ncbi:MAG: hypothetical protein KC563_05215 [Nitrospira sp.]|nr:hypothetical protein [Nitrospira sp.]MCA9475192.1 hypothetical protein [Nitrospira sp.]
MLKLIRVITLGAVFGALLVAVAEGTIMNKHLSEPALVPLDFLTWIERDADWLRESLKGQGVSSGFRITDMGLEASTVEALRIANRIRSFAYFAAPGLRPPYFDLSVSESGKDLIRCVTLFPRSIAPDIGAMDFDRKSFPVSKADPAILDLCRVQSEKGAKYRGLVRDQFRKKFFDAAGDLKIEFLDFNSNAAFIAQAIDHGFFVVQQDYTGRLRLGAE